MLDVGAELRRAELTSSEHWDPAEEAMPSPYLVALVLLLAIAFACLPGAVGAIALSGLSSPGPLSFVLGLFGTAVIGLKVGSIAYVVIREVGR